MSLVLVLRPRRMRGLRDAPVFAQRILDRVTSVVSMSDHDGTIVVDLETQGYIPPLNLVGVYLVRIAPEESIAAKIVSVESDDGTCRLFLEPWRVFINHDPFQPPLAHGFHLWLGAAWRHVLLARAA